MTLEAALEKIASLEKELAELKKSKAEDVESEAKDKQIADLKAKVSEYETQAEEALEDKADELEAEVLDNVLPAKRDGLKAKLAKMDSGQRVQFLEMLGETVEPIKAKEEQTGAGEADDGDEPDVSRVIARQKAAINEVADKQHLNMDTVEGVREATRIAFRDHPELF